MNVAPMRSCIEEWLERELKHAADERQQAVARIPIVVDDINEITAVDDINETTAARK
jgi:hypothetical protein